MREIKFRAWDKKNKKMVGWSKLVRDRWLLFSFFGNEFHPTNPPQYFWERMQYTGLKDKNGKEIYKGDIVKTCYSAGSVFWYEELASFGLKLNGGTIMTMKYIEEQKPLEVIGNIYENPNLITGREE